MREFPSSRRGVLGAGGCALLMIAATSMTLSSRLVVWNPSKSMPRGLYIRAPGPPTKGALVLAWLPSEIREIAAARGYLPVTVPALKPIAAIAGDTICADVDRLTINGEYTAPRSSEDHLGRPMPTWSGCKTLAAEQVFLLSTYAPNSFDGRYFGPSQTSDVIEKVVPVWTFP